MIKNENEKDIEWIGKFDGDQVFTWYYKGPISNYKWEKVCDENRENKSYWTEPEPTETSPIYKIEYYYNEEDFQKAWFQILLKG